MKGLFALRLRPGGLLAAIVLLSALGTIAGLLGRHAWWLDLASHPRLHASAILFLFAILLLLRRRWILATLSLVLVGVNLAVLLPHLLPTAEPWDGKGGTTKALLLNANSRGGDPEAVEQLLRSEEADFVVLLEMSERWKPMLDEIRSLYPHQERELRNDNFGIALLSRHPLQSSAIVQIGPTTVPSVIARVAWEGQELTIFGTHPLPPTEASLWRMRNEQLAALPPFLARTDGPLLVLADLNATPWSTFAQDFLEAAELESAAIGHGWQPTWPARLGILGIPIDYALHRGGLHIRDFRIGPRVGSDHRPIVVRFTSGDDR